MELTIDNSRFFSSVEALLRDGDTVRIRMKGHSMRPLLRSDKDEVVLRGCASDEELCEGDVVLFRYRGSHVLHRINRIADGEFTMAGDGNYRIREHCRREDILGRVVQVIRPSGRVVECSSRRWQRLSRLWLAIPEWLRRQLLRITWHLGKIFCR